MDAVPILKQGYLVKKGHIRHSWRTRWFTLKKNSLEYFKSRQDSKPKGRISLLGASLNCPVYNPSSSRQWLLIITTVEGKDYSIQAPDRDTRDDWKIALEEKIRRLDPSKRGLNDRGITLSRSLLPVEPTCITIADDHGDLTRHRDIIEAMQDMSAGIRLKELRRGRLGRHVDKYFTGTEAVDWLITWYFVTTRSEAIILCNSMLRNGLFHAIIEEDGGKSGLSKSTIADDKQACNVFQDSVMARYIFVSFVTSQNVERLLFCDPQDDEEEDVLSSPEMSSDISLQRINQTSTEDMTAIINSPCNFDNVIRQGYLLKQGHLRKNWKIRKFVLEKSCLYYYQIEKIKTKPQGIISLLGSTISPVVDGPPNITSIQKRNSLPARLLPQNNSPLTANTFCIETKDHTKYYIQADSDEDRLHWMIDIAKQIEEVTNSTINIHSEP